MYSVQIQPCSDNNGELPTDLDPELHDILLDFLDFFAIPSGLPPPRFQYHVIPLMEGSNPIKVKPYRYPHSQKSKIELMVTEMLTQGIKQPSTRPFSSPVLLVKIRMIWRFCTDYRALNTITVKDIFPFQLLMNY